jgi:hypothetical protein
LKLHKKAELFSIHSICYFWSDLQKIRSKYYIVWDIWTKKGQKSRLCRVLSSTFPLNLKVSRPFLSSVWLTRCFIAHEKTYRKVSSRSEWTFSFLFMTLTYICACDAWPNTWMYLAHVPGQFDTFMSKGENLYLSLYIFWEPKSQAEILCLDLHVIPLSKKWKRDRKKKHPEKIYWRMILMPLFISIVPSYYYLLAVVLGDPL